ncbi:hypothetical protein [Flavobacterium sp. J372]|uniref:hypothetical protein n=1 Tax=Flavobacterium sp. J372 TaxID=2898436 RepID=UPI0027E380C5|nr:hypothetical protein [Flavobacterium sp. J372]
MRLKVQSYRKKNSAVAVRTAVVKNETPNMEYLANGTFEPSQQLEFPAENNGRVVRVLVDEGDVVRKGQGPGSYKRRPAIGRAYQCAGSLQYCSGRQAAL